jgi:hypothetical protein
MSGPGNRDTDVPFSAEEAATIRRSVATPGAPVECPRCGTRLTSGLPLAGGGSVQMVWLLRCASCRRSMVVTDLPQ